MEPGWVNSCGTISSNFYLPPWTPEETTLIPLTAFVIKLPAEGGKALPGKYFKFQGICRRNHLLVEGNQLEFGKCRNSLLKDKQVSGIRRPESALTIKGTDLRQC